MKNHLNSLGPSSLQEADNMLSPKLNTNRGADYWKIVQVNHKYGKIPVKPTLQNLSKNRGTTLQIDINGNDYLPAEMALNQGSNSKATLKIKSTTSSNRSKSIEPTAKKLVSLPTTTKKKEAELWRLNESVIKVNELLDKNQDLN